MAKKKREKTEEDELDFKLPKFDEEKFLKRERRKERKGEALDGRLLPALRLIGD